MGPYGLTSHGKAVKSVTSGGQSIAIDQALEDLPMAPTYAIMAVSVYNIGWRA